MFEGVNWKKIPILNFLLYLEDYNLIKSYFILILALTPPIK